VRGITDPDTCPVVPSREHVGVLNDAAGTTVAVHDVASDSNPEPVKVNTVLTEPDVGVTIMSGVTVNGSVGVTSCTGDPLTCTNHEMSVVAYGLTTNVPCAIPGDTIEQVGEVISVLSSALVAPLYACTVQLVSDGFSPLPMKVTVDSSTALPGDSVRVGAPWVTFNTACAKSPTLGAHPVFPTQPVTSIKYSPGETLTITKLP